MNYKELITKFRQEADCIRRNQLASWAAGFDLAADAIETLLAERDAAVEIISRGEKRCRACIYDDHGIHDFPCCKCRETGGITDYWEWCKGKNLFAAMKGVNNETIDN